VKTFLDDIMTMIEDKLDHNLKQLNIDTSLICFRCEGEQITGDFL